MKYIVPVAVLAILLLQFTDAIPKSSVGGPITIAIVFLGAAIVVGMHEAWLNKRGVLGWILSIFVALIGVFLAAEILSTTFELVLPLVNPVLLNLRGSLAETSGLLPYVALTTMMLFNLLGSWLALKIVSRWR
ncbi:MAG: hypothetical protein ABL897_09620 [Hyphomicrobium sp.]